MGDLDAAPAVVQVFGNETAVAPIGPVLAAEETSVRQDVRVNPIRDPPFSHEFDELDLVGLPVPATLVVVVPNLLGGCQLGQVHVLHPTDLGQEILKVPALRKARELGGVVEPNVHNPLGPGIA